MSLYFDTHAHYNNDRYDQEFEGGASALLHSLLSGDIYAINNIGWDIESSRKAQQMSDEHPRLYFAAGVHPCDTYKYEDMESALGELEEIIISGKASGKLVALGEIGVDDEAIDFGHAAEVVFIGGEVDDGLAGGTNDLLCIVGEWAGGDRVGGEARL